MKGLFSIMEIGSSGLSAQRKHLNAVAQNIANVETTKASDGTPYKRRKVVFTEDPKKVTFADALNRSVRNLTRTHTKHITNSPAGSGKEGKIPFVSGKEVVIEPEAFKVVAAIDVSIIVPLLIFGGVLLWRRSAWGYIIAPMAGTLGSLYLLVLSVNSLVAIQRGLAEAPGELPVWGTLATFTTAATLVLLANVQSE